MMGERRQNKANSSNSINKNTKNRKKRSVNSGTNSTVNNKASSGTRGGGASPAMMVLAAIIVVILFVAIYLGTVSDWWNETYNPYNANVTLAPDTTLANSIAPQTSRPTSIPAIPNDKQLLMYVIDVGQSDCILLVSPNGKTMLIDAGDSKAYAAISTFLDEMGIKRLDAVVATHPHEDHIGSMAKVIENYEIGTFYICPETHTTKTYERMLTALDEKRVKTVEAWADTDALLAWDMNCKVRILSPIKGIEYDGLNNWSVVLKVEYGEYSAILTGDAEEEAEELMLQNSTANYFDADVLKLGHHGSSTSTCDAFLTAVSPQYALISVGAGNDYGHPHDETIAKLNKNGIITYRTNEVGTICVTFGSNGIDVRPCK